MRTQVSILHHDYPATVRAHVEERLQRLLRFADARVSLRARLERQRDEHRVELIATLPRGPVLVADARAEGFQGALEEALGRMTELLKRRQERRTRLRRRRRERDAA
ncbi:MAG: HPF/RaiA family ribosome-associated protein [Planctomycetes bacterium]|nr:HPF/RaiA family ribosome-associated protein [Planctomycetota bacterium]